jgi:curved DNA-binding protein CbpA
MRHKVTLYDTLGLERDATDEQIRSAFRRLAMKHHPDRFAGAQREEAEERFQVITEAFNVLSQPQSREKYDKEISKGTDNKAMDPKEIARRLTAKGSQSMREGNWAEALEHLKLAIDHDDDNAKAHYFYGQALGRVPSRVGDALRHVERAATLDPNNSAMRAEAAVLSLAAGMKSRAERLAHEALSLDPSNTKASDVLGQLDGDKGKGGGLLGRFRRKG